MKTPWTGRGVTDTLGTAGGIVLDDESTARVVLEDWLHDYYDGLDADDTAWIVDAATGTGITFEDNETLLGALAFVSSTTASGPRSGVLRRSMSTCRTGANR